MVSNSFKKHPTFFSSTAIGAVFAVVSATLTLFLPRGVVFAVGAVELTVSSIISLSAAVFIVICINYALSLYLFYRDRASAYALSFTSAVIGSALLIKVASLFYF